MWRAHTTPSQCRRVCKNGDGDTFQDPPPINFEEWKKEIDPKLVEMFQKAFQGAVHHRLRRPYRDVHPLNTCRVVH